jgi:LytR cell envelope-related transcriptional attenuator/Tetratricopeptide repeat
MSHRPTRFIASATAIAAIAACSTTAVIPEGSDPNKPGAWKISGVQSVTHSESSGRSFYALGRYHDGMRAWDKSIAAYQKSIAADKTNPEAFNALGAALAQRQRLGEAEEAFQVALALNPKLAHVQSNLGYVQMMQPGKAQAAVATLKAAVRLDPSNTVALTHLRDAVAQWDTARGLEPSLAAVADTAPTTANASASTNATAMAADLPAATTAAPPANPTASTVIASQPPLPGSVEVMAPITQVAMNVPQGEQLYDAAPTTVRALAVASAAPVAQPAAARAATATPAPVATPSTTASPTPSRTMRVMTTPNLPAMVQTSTARPGQAAVSARSTPVMASQSPLITVALTPVASTPTPTTATAMPVPTATQAPAADKLPNWLAWMKATTPNPTLEVTGAPGSDASAKQVSTWLQKQGVTVNRVGMQRGTVPTQSVLHYQAGNREDALRVARALPVKVPVVWAGGVAMTHDIRLTLGSDWQRQAACLQKQTCVMPRTTVAMAQVAASR